MKLREIKSIEDWRKLRILYKEAFPECERKPLWLVWLVKKQKKTHVWIVERSGEFAGFAITMYGKDLVLLDYLAICPAMRGDKLGTRTLQALQEYYGDKRLFLEIENVYEEAENLPDRIRRKRFYQNNDMREMGILVNAFGAQLELLTYKCEVSFQEYYELYCYCYGKWAAENLKELPYPEEVRKGKVI